MNKVGILAFVTLGLSNASFAAPIASGAATLLSTAPSSLALNALTSDTVVYVFQESALSLAAKLNVDANGAGTFNSGASLNGGSIAKNTVVESFIFHADTATRGGQEFIGSVTFDAPILGVISKATKLDNTDPILGNPNTTYDTGNATRDLEMGNPTDSFTISSDLRTLSFDVKVTGNMDEFRVLTNTPEPGTLWITLLGIPGVFIVRRRLK